MHLPELPTIFVKNGEERKVFFTVQARELTEMGWVEKGKETPAPAPKKTVKKSAPESAPAPKPVVERTVVEEPVAEEGSK